MDETLYCEICGGELEYIGTLGRLAHYRCRDCGLNSEVELKEMPADKIAEDLIESSARADELFDLDELEEFAETYPKKE